MMLLQQQQKQCHVCGSYSTYLDKRKRSVWRLLDDKYTCTTCYQRIVVYPVWSPIQRIRRITYKGRRIYLKHKARKGQCEKCGKKVGDEYVNSRGKLVIVKRTAIHHFEYHDDDFVKDTIEVCAGCHCLITLPNTKTKEDEPVQ